MRLLVRFASLALLAACGRAAAPAHDPIAVQPGAALPAAVESCAVLGEVKDGRRCKVYDTKAQAFAPADAFTNRVFLYERWLDLYNTAERQVIVRNLKEPMAPGDPESRWSDARYLDYLDDFGDSAGFGEEAQISASYRYAVTGTEADYQRLESYVRGSVLQWEATGMEGYLARFHYAGVTAGTPLVNGRAMVVRANDEGNAFDIPTAVLDRFPDYYQAAGVRPGWSGHVSIDAYSGPMHAWPIAFSLLRDPALKARMARHYGCFLKRLRIFKVVNLSKNAALQAEVAKYLTTGILHLDPDDPDLAKSDTVWGFYLPQFNKNSAASYPRECPTALAEEASAADTVDVTQVGWEGKLITLFLRMSDGSDQADSMDFAYFASLRAGDAAMILSYALSAWRMTGDAAFLQWRDRVLIGKANAQQVTKTVGAFLPPKPCRTYYRSANVYTAHFVELMSDGDPASHAFALDVWQRKFAGKEELGLGDPLFAVLYSAALGKHTAEADDALSQLASFGGTRDLPDSPRRNYAFDLSKNPPPGITASKADKADLDLCQAPITVLGVTIPTGDPIDPNVLYANKAPGLMDRPPDNWQWEKDPFRLTRLPGDAGRQQYAGLDLIEPYWIARYYKLLPDAHSVLAWGPP